MGLSSLISRVTALTNAVNSIALKAKIISELPSATTPLDSADLFHVSQSGVDKKVAFSDVGGTPAAPGKIQYGSFMIYGASGNGLSTLQSGDMVSGWWSTTEFWSLARYNGGDTGVKTNYTVINSTEL